MDKPICTLWVQFNGPIFQRLKVDEINPQNRKYMKSAVSAGLKVRDNPIIVPIKTPHIRGFCLEIQCLNPPILELNKCPDMNKIAIPKVRNFISGRCSNIS
jgi:hypothetical protein